MLFRASWKYLLHIPAEPHSREVTPSQLSDHLITANKDLSDSNQVITTCNTKGQLHQRRELSGTVLVFDTVALPTYAIICRILLFLLVRHQRLRWRTVYLYSWRGVRGFAGLEGRFGSPRFAWGGARPGSDGWIKSAGCDHGGYDSSIWWRHVEQEPDGFEPRWQQHSGRKLQWKNEFWHLQLEEGDKSDTRIQLLFVQFVLIAVGCLRWHFKRNSRCVCLFLAWVNGMST